MTKQTNTCPPAAKPLGVWIDELKADRDEWKARAVRLEAGLREIAKPRSQFNEHAGMAGSADAEALKEAERLAVIALNTGCATQADAEQLRAAVNAYCKARKGGDT